jgi:drug/metabolite transporter (DMT)-like permease
MEGIDTLIKYIPYLIPVVIVQLILLVVALLDLLKREKTRGPKWVWVLVILFVNLLGPIIYFLFGRDNES